MWRWSRFPITGFVRCVQAPGEELGRLGEIRLIHIHNAHVIQHRVQEVHVSAFFGCEQHLTVVIQGLSVVAEVVVHFADTDKIVQC